MTRMKRPCCGADYTPGMGECNCGAAEVAIKLEPAKRYQRAVFRYDPVKGFVLDHMEQSSDGKTWERDDGFTIEAERWTNEDITEVELQDFVSGVRALYPRKSFGPHGMELRRVLDLLSISRERDDA